MRQLFRKKGIVDGRQGVATILLVLTLTIFIIAVAAAVSITSFNETTISQDFRNSSQALTYAKAGVQDALIKIAREGKYISTGYTIEFVSGGCAAPYDGCVTVTVTSETSPKTILSIGQVKNNFRKVQVVVYLDTNWVITNTVSSEPTN